METAHGVKSSFAALYSIPSEILHWNMKTATLDATMFLLSLRKRLPREDVMSSLRGAGLRLVDDGQGERHKEWEREIHSRYEKLPELKKTINRLAEERKMEVCEDTRNFAYPADHIPPVHPGPKLNASATEFFVESENHKAIEGWQIEKVESILGTNINWIGGVFIKGGTENAHPFARRFCPFPHSLLVEPNILARSKDIAMALESENLEIDEKLYHPTLLYVRFKGSRRENVYQLKNYLTEKYPNLINAVHYENMPMQSPQQAVWNRSRIHADQLGAGAGTPIGKSQVPVAVIDAGVEFDNDTGSIPFYDGWNAYTGLPDRGTPGYDAHGTLCAGIISHDSANSFGMVPEPGLHPIMSVIVQNFSDAQIALAIAYAANHNGRVISMSVSDNDGTWNPLTVDPVLRQVSDRNYTICVSVGNDDLNRIYYPANRDTVIGVGACDRVHDIRVATPEYSWGSNYGPELSVVAPGINITSTDLNGSRGKNTAPGTAGSSYTEFWGTSAATPHVAAVAAMVVSKCISLQLTYTWLSVKRRIQYTADKIGDPATYHPAPPDHAARNNLVGFGRVNAKAALSFSNQLEFDSP